MARGLGAVARAHTALGLARDLLEARRAVTCADARALVECPRDWQCRLEEAATAWSGVLRVRAVVEAPRVNPGPGGPEPRAALATLVAVENCHGP